VHVSLIYPYGSVPGEAWREYRAALAARALVAAGHSVTWWVASFEHLSKQFRTRDFELRSIQPGFDIAIVPTTGYSRHISLRRIRFERSFARAVRAFSSTQPRPDVIVLFEPALFTSGPIAAMADELGVPLVLDACDLWPELFQIALPRPLRFLGRILLAPLRRRRAKLARHSAGYVAVSKDYLSLMQSLAPRAIADVVYVGVDVSLVHRGMAAELTLPHGVASRRKEEEDFWVVYAGSLGPNYDIPTILRAADILLREASRITLVIAGDGEMRTKLQSAIASRALRNCIYLGPLAAESVTRLYAFCDAALCTYVEDSTVSMPVKAYDYLAAGLPLINSLGRDLGEFVRTHEVGVQYEAENAESLANAIRVLADNPNLRARLAENAARLGQEFDARVQYARFVDVIESALRAHLPPRTAT
jgi:glycosyltransferase involved in cell wall biosynthesis